jgi:hypothetical protein
VIRPREKLPYWEKRSTLQTGRPMPAPIRPADSDIALYADRALARSAASMRGGLEVLMLGVTRAIAAMPWPAGTSLLAVDWSRGMIRRFWPAGEVPAGANLAIGDWREMPVAGASRDFVVGDACYAALATLDDCAALHAELARVLRPGAWWVQRSFLRPETPENLDRLFAELETGRIGVFEVFCWRLAMALHGQAGEGVRCDDVWREWSGRMRDPRALFERLGWAPAILATIERWQGEATRILFPSLAEVRRLAAPDFEVLEIRYPDYEMGDRCPMLVLRRR